MKCNEDKINSISDSRLPEDSSHISCTVGHCEDNGIAFLRHCNLELSSEAIHQKTENMRLRKLCDVEKQRSRELAQRLNHLSKRNQVLEAQLATVGGELDNENYIAVDSDIFSSRKMLSILVDKYHSFPWQNGSTTQTVLPNQGDKSDAASSEGWKEVSQKLLQQMKQEMQELEELNHHFPNSESDNSFVIEDAYFVKELEMKMDNLSLLTDSLKDDLLLQRRKLLLLMTKINQDNSGTDENLGSKVLNVYQHDISKSIVQNVKAKPSNEAYRNYFIKHLRNVSLNSTARVQHVIPIEEKVVSQNQEMLTAKQICTERLPKYNFSGDEEACKCEVSRKTVATVEERICPICQVGFPTTVLQKDFEAHVVNHLEVESASLLEEYIVL